jgi:hypothetical protein
LAASASAKTVAVMPSAALDTQYSARDGDETSAEIEVMKTMEGKSPSRLGF